MPLGYKYVKSDVDSQVNWYEVGKNMSDMLAETSRVREEKKSAIDKATRETLNELATSPNGEHVGAREAALEFADKASNFVRIQEKLLKSGQLSLKDYTIFRQNLNDGTDKAFNALKVYQENYGNSMQRYRDGKASLYETRKRAQGEGFGNWTKSGLYITPNGTVMAGMKTEKEVEGQKVWTMDDAPGKTASVDWINGMLVGEWDKYDYVTPVKTFVDNLGEDKRVALTLGGITRQGKIESVEDIKSRKDIDPTTQLELFKFIDAENNGIQAILGTPANKLSILLDHKKDAPNKQPYDITNSPEEAKKNPNLVLEVINPDTGQGDFVFTDEQNKAAEDFIRSQMRVAYDYKEEKSAVNAVARDEESQDAKDARENKRLEEAAVGTWGDVFTALTPDAKRRALTTALSTKPAQKRGIMDVDLSVPGKVTFINKDETRNITKDFDFETGTLGEWNAIGNILHGVDDVTTVMARNKGGDPNMLANAQQKTLTGVRAGYTKVKDPAIEFSTKVKASMASLIKNRGQDKKLKDKEAASEISKMLDGTGITVVPNTGVNAYNSVNLKIGDQEYLYPVNYNTTLNNKGKPNDPGEFAKAQTETRNLIEWIEANTPAANKITILKKAGTQAP